MKMTFLALALLLIMGGATGCGYTTSQGSTKIIDTSADNIGGTGTNSADIRSMAGRMAREIAGLKWGQRHHVPTIAVLPITNNTRFRIDPVVLQNKLVKDLVNMSQGEIAFVARDSERAVMHERRKKRAGHYTANKHEHAMRGADYLLRGDMRALSKASRQGVSDYILYSFKLIDAESGVIKWMGDYETKKVSDVGVVYQ